MNTAKKPALILISISLALLIISFVFTGLQIPKKRTYELEYERVTAIISGMDSEHVQGNTRYHLYVAFEIDGKKYNVKTEGGAYIWEIYNYKKLLGKEVEIYFNPLNPNKVIRVSDSDIFSVISVFFFSFTVVLFTVGAMLLIHKTDKAALKRLFIVWLPILIIGIASTLLFWLALPTGGFGDIFREISGSIGFTVIAGIALLAAVTDSLIHLKAKKVRNT